MTRRSPALGFLVESAALARIAELAKQHGRGDMTARNIIDRKATADREGQLKAMTRRMWALGDYHRFALATVWQLGPILVRACGIGAGQRVLDVAAGTGNVAIRAAEIGAHVVASDLTPENFTAGRRAAAASGVELEWAEADAEHLPFADADFDVVTSSLGAIFAPHHQAVADEMLRVCRPGGTIGMITFRPEGLAAEFFALLDSYAPDPPPGALPPLLWGNEDHVRALFGDRVDSLEMTRGQYVEQSEDGPAAYQALFEDTFGPLIAIRASLAADPEREQALTRDFRDFTIRGNRGEKGGVAAYPYEYLLIIARKRGR